MFDQTCTRRGLLRTVGALTSATGLGGCIGGPSTTDETRASARRTDREPSVTDTPPSPTDRNLSTPTFNRERPYAEYAATPAEFHLSGSYNLTSVHPVIAANNRSAFGDAYRRFQYRWVQRVGGLPLREHGLTVWIRDTIAVVADFEQSTIESWLEPYPMEHMESYHGFELYTGTMSGVSQQTVGIGNGTIFMHNTATEEDARDRIVHLIDLQRGVEQSYYEDASVYTNVVDYLPQGVYTHVLPNIREIDYWPSRYSVRSVGETLLFDGDRSPATGRTVFQFANSVTSPRRQTAEILSNRDSLVQFPLIDPEIRVQEKNVVVVTDSVDPSEAF